MTAYVGIFEAWSETEGKTKTVGNVFLIVLGEKDFSISQEGVCGDPGHYSRG